MINILDNRSIIYQSEEGALRLTMRTDKDSVWLTMSDIAKLFNVTKSTISQCIQLIFQAQEFDTELVRRKFSRQAADGSSHEVNHYNLDIILTIGYRLKSKNALEFQHWATKTLKKYITSGYVLNVKGITQNSEKLAEIQNILQFIIQNTTKSSLNEHEKSSFLDLIKDYTNIVFDEAKAISTDNLDDPNSLNLIKVSLTLDDYLKAIFTLKQDLLDSGEASIFFGQQYKAKFTRIISLVNERFNGREIHSTIEERASLLLYLIIKNHPFVDGNRRIGSFLFLYLLDQNNYLYKEKGQRKISDSSLIALTKLISQSSLDEKNAMLKLIKTLIV